MTSKLALSFALAALILAAGGFLAVWNRLGDEAVEQRRPQGRPPGVVPAETPKVVDNPLETNDLGQKLDWVVVKLEEMSVNDYDSYTEFSQDLFALKREVRQLKGTLKQIVQGLGTGPGGISPIGWGLAPRAAEITDALKGAYKEAAAKHGVEVNDGRVIVRGFLNFTPRTNMPIEYFITRYPESNHETLVHLVGNVDLESMGENPFSALRGLPTALYKGLIAAGFDQGTPAHPDPDGSWVLASGTPLYVGVRYTIDGVTHVARATDWVIDPRADTVLPPDCFRFTGGTRSEDPDTGEEVLSAEMMGLIASVYSGQYTALVEVSLESSLRNDFTYNFARIPKKQAEGPLYLDVIFSRTPIETVGDGALPLERPPAGDSGARPDDESATEGDG